jgi:hypothetical protein
MFFKRKESDHMKALAELLAHSDNRESFLGVKDVNLPTAQQIQQKAAQLARYSESKDYLVYVEETWGRILNHLDTILNDRTTYEQVQYHRGALKEALDLLRVSYQARNIVTQQPQPATEE